VPHTAAKYRYNLINIYPLAVLIASQSFLSLDTYELLWCSRISCFW
jgi:hypothetical protein